MPAGVTTLLAVRTAAAQRADMPTPSTTTFVTTAEWNALIQESYFELYGLLAQKFGDDYFVSVSSNITTDGANDAYALPTDFFKLLGVDLQIGGTSNAWVTLQQFTFTERNRYALPNFQAYFGVTNLRYRLRGSDLLLSPLPAAGQVLRVWYVPRLATLTQDADTLDGVNGWESYVIVDAARKALLKEESDTSALERDKAGLIARIEAEAENRDATGFGQTADVRAGPYGWSRDGGNYGSGWGY